MSRLVVRRPIVCHAAAGVLRASIMRTARTSKRFRVNHSAAKPLYGSMRTPSPQESMLNTPSERLSVQDCFLIDM